MDDRLNAQELDITVDHTGKVWVNVDGKCVLRIGHVARVQMDDPMRGLDIVHDDTAPAPKIEDL